MNPIIYRELFDLEYKVSRQAVDFILDEFDKYQIDAYDIIDYDHSVIIKFNRKLEGLPLVRGELRVDRIQKKFIISGYCDGYLLPARGNWDMVVDYLYKLINT
jgi:hypothetical protein